MGEAVELGIDALEGLAQGRWRIGPDDVVEAGTGEAGMSPGEEDRRGQAEIADLVAMGAGVRSISPCRRSRRRW